MMDKKREMFEALTPEEQAEFKDSVRYFRHPDFAKQSGNFFDLNGNTIKENPYSTYKSAFQMHMKTWYNIDLNGTKKEENSSSDSTNTVPDENLISQERKKAYRQDSLSNHNSRKFQKSPYSETLNIQTSPSESTQNNDFLEKKVMEETLFSKEQTQKGTNDQNIEKETQNQPQNNEVDDILKHMSTPNPESDFFKRTGTAVHHDDDQLEKQIKEKVSEMKRLQSRKQEHNIDFEGPPVSDRDPFIGNWNNQPKDNTPFFSKWKRNVDEQNKLNIHSDDSRDSFVKSNSFIIFSITVVLTYSIVMYKNSRGHDNPIGDVNFENSNKPEK